MCFHETPSKKRKMNGMLGDSELSSIDASLSHSWTPGALLANVPRNPYILLVLNQPIGNPDLFLNMCDSSVYWIAADGGANRIRDLGLDEAESERRAIPDLICGDLDSITANNLAYFRQKRVRVEIMPDQNSTDFTKALRFVSDNREEILQELNLLTSTEVESAIVDTVVFGGLGGRADQAFSQLHHLYTAQQDPTINCGDIYLFTPESIIFLLHKGDNVIQVPVKAGQFDDNIGLIPLAGPAMITTHGLEWDVEDWETEIGLQISTSNHVQNEIVCVSTTVPILCTLELADKPRCVGPKLSATTDQLSKRNANDPLTDTEVANMLSDLQGRITTLEALLLKGQNSSVSNSMMTNDQTRMSGTVDIRAKAGKSIELSKAAESVQSEANLPMLLTTMSKWLKDLAELTEKYAAVAEG